MSVPGPRRLTRARRLSAGALVVVLPLLFATCELDKLVTPPETGLLAVAPDTLADSAVVGSTALHSVSLELMPEGTSALDWQVGTARSSPWVGFAATNGTAPDTLTVQLDPTGLAVGTYHDTLVLSSSNSDAAPARVPVTFTIVPCHEIAVALDTLIGAALTPTDCASPTHPGRFARRFRFDADAGDSLSVLLQATGFSGLVVVDTILETAACGGTTGDPCIHYLRLPVTRSYVVEVTSGSAGETGAFTLSLHRPRAPAAPDTLAQLRADSTTAIAVGGATPQLAAVFRARLSDPDGVDTLRIEVELQPVANAFSGAATRTGGPVAITGRGYVAVSPLGDDVSFHWQARTRDQTGRVSPWVAFGGNADAPLPAALDFRTLVPQPPAVPAALAQFKGDGVTAMVVGDTNETRSAVFRALLTDPDPGDQVRLEVELKPVGTAFDSTGIVPSPTVTSGNAASVTVGSLLDNTAYHWRARAVDAGGTGSAWVSFGGNPEITADFRVVIPATHLVFTVQPQATAAGSPIAPPVEVRAQDGIGQTVQSFTGSVTIALDSNPAGGTLAGTTTVTAIAGVATFSNLRLDKAGRGYRLSATATALLAASDTFSVLPGTPAALAFTAQPSTVAAGDSIKPPVAVAVRDVHGNTVTSYADTVRVSIAANPGGGTLSGTRARPAVNGVATFPDLAIDKTGTGYTLLAQAAALPTTTSAAFDVVPQGIAHFEFTVQPSDGVAGQALIPSVEVTAKDALGNTVTTFNGAVAMALGANPAGGTLSGTLSAVAVDGVATFTNLRIGKAGAGYTLVAGAPGVNTGTSQAFDIAPGAAAVLAFTVGPQTTAAGALLQPAIQVVARDAFGNGVPSFTDSVTIALGSNPAGGTLAGTVRVAAVNGIATFANLSIAKAGTGYALAATATGLTGAASGVFDITAGPATTLAFTVEPSATPAGSFITPAVQVSARDAFDNLATSYAGPVTLALLPHASGASLSGTTTINASSGVATFADLAVDKAGVGFNLGAANGGLAGDTSVAFTVTPGAAGRLAIVTPPPTNAQSGIAFTPQPAVQVQDNSGNPVAQPGLTVTASVSAGPPGSTVRSATATTDGTGLATFAGLGLSGLVGNYTLTFTSPGLTAVSAGPIALAPGNPAVLAVTTQPSAIAQNGVAFGQQPVVQIEDSAGNPVALASVQVTAAIASGGGALSGTNPIATDGVGEAAFTDLAITGTVGPRVLAFTAPGLAGVSSTTIDLQAGAATTLALNAGDNQSATAGTAVAIAPSVKATDASGNAVGGVSVTFAVLSGGGSVVPVTSVATGSNGVATATSWTLGPTAGKNELTATSTPALSGSPVTFTATATVGAATAIVKTGGDNLTGPVLSTLGTPHEVTVRDANGNGVPGVVVSWAAVGGSVLPTLDTTDAQGKSTAVRTLGAIAGTQTTSATALISGTPSVTFNITATSSGASQMVAFSGDGQTDTVGQTVPQPLVVRVSDASNNPVSGVTVTWSVTLGNGLVGGASSTTSVTDAQGLASIAWTLGPLTNAQGVRATAAGAPVNFTATALPGPVSAAQSSVTTAPASIAASSGSVTSTITVTARDANGNVIQGATVALAATGGSNALTQPAGPTNGAGQTTGTISSTLAEVKTISATINGVAITQQPTVTVTPAAATTLAFLTQPHDAQAGTSIAPPVQVEILDQFANRTTATNGVLVAILANPGGGSLTGQGTVAPLAAVNGVATFPDLAIDKVGVGYTLRATATGLASDTSTAFAITPAAAATLSLVSGAGQIDTVAATLPNPYVVRVTDAFGNGVPGVAVTWTVLSGGGTLTPTAPTTDASGFSSAIRVFGTVAGPHSSQASVAGLAGSPVGFATSALPATATNLQFVTQPANATAGVAIAPTVQVAAKDQFGNTVITPSRSVTVALAANPGADTLGGTKTHATTGGIAGFTDLILHNAAAGYTLSAASAGLTDATSTAFTISAASVSASQSTVVAAPGTITASAGSSASTITVTARDAFGNAVANQSVTLVATGAGNTLTQPAALTDAAGVAMGTLSSITAGIKTVAASIGGTAVTQTAAVTVLPAAADHLAFRVQPSNVVSGAAIAPAVEVSARDQFNNRDSTFVGAITITLGNNPGAATLTGTTSTTAVKGLAVFNDLHVDKAGAGYTLVASDGGPLVDTTSIGFNVAPAAATQLAFTLQPAGAAAGSAISPAVQVTARDAAGNRDTTFTGTIVVALGSNPGAATLNGTLSVAAVAGVASFPDLSLNVAAAGYTLTATSGVLTQATSSAFTITPAAATALFFTVQPSNATAGAAVAPPIQVTARDQFGNTATAFVGSVTLDTVSHVSGGALNGTRTVAAVAGVATFNNVFVNTAATGYTLKALAGGLNGDTSTAFNVAPGTATQLAFTVQPSAVTAGATIAPAVQVTVRDAQGNAVTGFVGSVTVAIGTNPGGGTLSGTTSQPVASGVATFGNLSINRSGTGYTVTAAATALTGATSAGFNVTPGAATTLQVDASPGTATAGATLTPAPLISARDAQGNIVTAFTDTVVIAIANNPGGGTLSGSTRVAAVGGVATFSGLSINKSSSGYTLAVTSGALTPDTTTAFTINPGAVAALVWDVQPVNPTVNAAITPSLRVRRVDQFGNTVPNPSRNITVALATNPTSATLGGTLTRSTATSGADSGTAVFDNLTINLVGSGYVLSANQVTGPNLPLALTSSFNVAAAAATQLVFTTQPSTVNAGAAISPAVVVTARDQFGNTATGFTGQVTVAIGTNGGGSGVLSGTLTVNAVAGVATFSNLSLDKVGTGYTLTAAATALTGTTSAAFNVTPGTATRVVFTQEPTNVVAGAAFSPTVQVAARDSLGNLVTGFTGGITLAIANNVNGATLGGTATVTAVGGVASFPTVFLNKAGAGYTLAASSGALLPDTSAAFTVSPSTFSATHSSVLASPATITASNGASATTITVTARDSFDNTLVGAAVTLAATGTNNAFTAGGAGTTNGSGVFTSDFSSTRAEVKTISAAVSATAVTQTAAVAVLPAAADHLAFSVQPSNVVSGAAIAPAVQVTALDPFNNRDSTFTGTITITLGNNPGAGTLTGTTSAAAVKGLAVFANLRVDKAGAGYTLVASDGGPLVDTTSAAFNVLPAAATQLAFTVQPTSATAGAALTPTVQVTARDGAGNHDTTFTDTIVVALGTNPGGATLSGTLRVKAVAGVASFSNLSLDKVGTGYALTAVAGALTQATSAAFNITPAAASALVFTVQPSNATAGTAIAPPIQVTARDAFGNTATGFVGSVTLDTVSHANGGVLNGTTTVTATAGVATFANVFLNTAGTGYTLKALAGGLNGDTSAAFTIAPTAATALFFTVQPSNATAGADIAPPIQVTARDQFGNTATGFVGSVTLDTVSHASGAALNGTTTVSAVAGVATFANVSINTVGTGYTLKALAGGLNGDTSSTFDVSAGAAAQLAFTVQPTDVKDGAAITPAVQVTALDAHGNPVPTFVGNVSIAIGTNPGGGTLAGTTTRPAVSGVATFDDLSIDVTGTGYTLDATATGLSGATSAAFTVLPGLARRLLVTTQPGNEPAGATIAPAPQVSARDSLGNIVTSFTDTVEIAILDNPGGGTLSGTTRKAATAGVVVFNDLSIDKSSSGYTLVVTSGGLDPDTTATFTIIPGPPVSMVFDVQPTTTVVNSVIAPPLRLRRLDAFGNLVVSPRRDVDLTIASGPGGAVLGGTTTQRTGATGGPDSGIAVFDDLTIDVVGSYVLNAHVAAGIIPDQLSATFDIVPGPVSASQSTVAAAPDTITASNGSIASTITVTARDQFNNPIVGAAVTVVATGSGNAFSPSASGTTGVGGVFTTAFSSTVAADKTISATIGGVAVTQTTTVTVVPAAVSGSLSTLAAVPDTITASSGGSLSAISVTARDNFGNPIPGATVVLAVTGTGNALTQPGLTGGVGVATGFLSSTVAESKTVTATVNGTGLVQTAAVVVLPTAVSAGNSTVAAAPDSITASSGGSASTITVTARDQFNNPIAGAAVVLAATGTNNTLTQPLGTTNGSGVATGTLSSTTAELKTVSATIGGVAVTQTATVTVLPTAVSGSLSTLAAVPDTITASSGGSVSAISVTARDQFGNPIPGATVVLAVTGSGNTLTQPGLTGGAGVATGFLSSTVAEDKTVTATVDGTGLVQPATVVVLPSAASATLSTVTATPDTITASNGLLQSTVTVTARDQFNNLIPSATVVLNATGAQPNLTQPAGPTNGAGVATGALSSTKKGNKQVGATVDGVLLAQTYPVNVKAGPVSPLHTLIVAIPDTITASNGSSQATIIVTARDEFDNTIPGATAVLAATVGGSFSQPPATDTGGVASGQFSSTAAGTQVISVTVDGVTVTTTATITVVPAAAANLALVSGNAATDTVDATLPAYVVEVTDAFGNAVSGVTVTWTVTGGGGTIAGSSTSTTTTTNGSGQASATRVLGTTPGAATVTAAVSGLSGSPVGFTATVLPGDVASLTFTQQPPITQLANTAFTVEVTAFDRHGNTATGFTGNVGMAIGTSAGGTLSGTIPKAAVAGVATFNDLSIDFLGAYTLQASVGSIVVVSNLFTIL